VSNEIIEQLDHVIQLLNIQPTVVQQSNGSLLNSQILERFTPSERRTNASIIQWVPPIPNWNPWIASNIDEGPLATATMESICADLRHAEQYKNDSELKLRLEERLKLPVNKYRQEILAQIKTNNVILIRGATGCGKTTQVFAFFQEEDFSSKNKFLRFHNLFLMMQLNKIKVLFVILSLLNHVESVPFLLLNVFVGVCFNYLFD
jgi:ATP-dependent RNA helicase A